MTTIEKFVTRAQEGVVQAGRQLARAQGEVISELMEARANVTAGLPSAAHLVETNYAFAGQLLQIQKELMLHWVAGLARTDPVKPSSASSGSSN